MHLYGLLCIISALVCLYEAAPRNHGFGPKLGSLEHRQSLLKRLNGRKTQVHGKRSKDIRIDMDNMEHLSLDPKLSVFTTDKLPDDPHFMPSIGNGHIAHVINSNIIYMNGVYNGKGSQSHRAQIPDLCGVKIINTTLDEPQVSYSLDIGQGMYIEEYSTDFQIVRLKKYAHSIANRLLITEIETINLGPSALNISLKHADDVITPDINFNVTNEEGFRLLEGYIKETEGESSLNATVAVIASFKFPEVISVPRYQHSSSLCLQSIGYFDQTVTYSFFYGEAIYLNGTLEKNQATGMDYIIWKKGRIETPGNDQITSLVYSSLYYLMTSIPTPDGVPSLPFMGLSPVGLAEGGSNADYMGHVFWDQEIYMYPPIQLLFPKAGRKMLSSRARTLKAAQNNAKQQGYKGAMYPFESAVTERKLNILDNEKYAIHVSGDVALAFALDFLTTNDTAYFSGVGGDVIQNVADFWVSRVTYSQAKKLYEINDVMGPDSYHYPVNNSAYTNVLASTSLEIAAYILPKVNKTVNPQYAKIADNIYIPYDKVNNWTPEYDGYTNGTKIGQADVMLTYWPVIQKAKEEQITNDLNAYINVTESEPSMSWAMYTIGWLMAGNNQAAGDTFQKQFQCVNGPFNIWTEEGNGKGPVNFLTGMGAFLQSLLFGYGGFRFDVEGLRMNPSIPPGASDLNIYGIDYLQTSLDVLCSSSNMTVTVSKEETPLDIKLAGGSRQHLLPRMPIVVKRQEAMIVARSNVF